MPRLAVELQDPKTICLGTAYQGLVVELKDLWTICLCTAYKGLALEMHDSKDYMSKYSTPRTSC
jgi:hypothetical protein